MLRLANIVLITRLLLLPARPKSLRGRGVGEVAVRCAGRVAGRAGLRLEAGGRTRTRGEHLGAQSGRVVSVLDGLVSLVQAVLPWARSA
jgi:hypothetical protein